MIINFRNPSVKLVEELDSRRSAWQRSRPFMEVDDEEMEKVVIADLPVNSFKVYVLEIDSSILFRDLLFTVRGIHPWATSMRQLKSTPDNTLMSSEYESEDGLKSLEIMMSIFYDLQSEGYPQDVTKRHLPMATSVQYSVVIDHRSLIAILKTLKETSKMLYEVYGTMILDAVGLTEDELNSSYVSSIYDSLSLNKSDYDLVRHTYKTGSVTEAFGLVAGGWELNSNIMAQVIRMHQATVKNGLWNIVKDIDSVSDDSSTKFYNKLTCNTLVPVAVYASKEVMERTAKVRVAWFGQWDDKDSGWSPIVGSYIKDMTPEEFWKFAGLENGNDKNVANMMGAVQGKEAHPPSPVLLEKPDLVPYRLNKYKSDSVISQKWKEVYDAGLINDNPNNEYRLIYEKAIEENGYPE